MAFTNQKPRSTSRRSGANLRLDMAEQVRRLHDKPLQLEYFRAKVEGAETPEDKRAALRRLASEAGQAANLAFSLMRNPSLSTDAFRPIFVDYATLMLGSYYEAAMISKSLPNEVDRLIFKDIVFDAVNTFNGSGGFGTFSFVPRRREKKQRYLIHKLMELRKEAEQIKEPDTPF